MGWSSRYIRSNVEVTFKTTRPNAFDRNFFFLYDSFNYCNFFLEPHSNLTITVR